VRDARDGSVCGAAFWSGSSGSVIIEPKAKAYLPGVGACGGGRRRWQAVVVGGAHGGTQAGRVDCRGGSCSEGGALCEEGPRDHAPEAFLAAVQAYSVHARGSG
jgi:hypothetical protein